MTWKLKLLLLSLVIVFSCNIKSREFSYFSFNDLAPNNKLMVTGLKVITSTYMGEITAISFNKFGLNVIDTVVRTKENLYIYDKRYYVIDDSLDDNLKVCTIIRDTATALIFSKFKSTFKFIGLEKSINDSIILLKLARGSLFLTKFDIDSIDLIRKHLEDKMFYREDFFVHFNYKGDSLNYKLIQDYHSYKIEPKSYESIKAEFGIIFLDIDSLNKKILYNQI